MPSLGPVRNVDAQSEHQNTTLDHSYYVNRALLDGFFMSGVGHQSKSRFAPKTLSQMQLVQNQPCTWHNLSAVSKSPPDPLSS